MRCGRQEAGERRKDGDGGGGKVDDSEWEDVIIWNAWDE